jgi:hypothetical protein
MKTGLNRIDQQTASKLVSYGWTPEQVSRKLKIDVSVLEVWWEHLTPEGWAAYRAKAQKDREAATRVTENISAKDAVALAREQILLEDKIRAEVRAEMAGAGNEPTKTQSAKAETNAAQKIESDAPEGQELSATKPKREGPAKRRRTRRDTEAAA